jgi:hypothetical protein
MPAKTLKTERDKKYGSEAVECVHSSQAEKCLKMFPFHMRWYPLEACILPVKTDSPSFVSDDRRSASLMLKVLVPHQFWATASCPKAIHPVTCVRRDCGCRRHWTLPRGALTAVLVFLLPETKLPSPHDTQLLSPLRPSGNYMNHLLWQSVMLHFEFIGFAWFSL